MTVLPYQLANRCAALETDLANLLAFAQQGHAHGAVVDTVRERVAQVTALVAQVNGLPDVSRMPVRLGYATHLCITGAEQVGFGDVIEPLALVAELAANCGALTLTVLPSMVGLVRDSTTVYDNVRVVGPTAAVEGVTKTASWLSLRLKPMYRRPHGQPFLRATDGPCALPVHRDDGSLHIGIAWKSHHAQIEQCRRSAPAAVVAGPLLQLPGVVLHSLQPDRHHECDGLPVHGHEFRDFRESARLVARLDCVVSIDAAAAHLAAGLGVPTFCIVGPGQDGRWEKSGSRSAWYGAMHLVHTSGWPRTPDDPNGIRVGAEQCAALIRAGTLPPRLPFVARTVGRRTIETGTEWQLLRRDLEVLVQYAALETITPHEATQMMASLHAFTSRVTGRGLAA